MNRLFILFIAIGLLNCSYVKTTPNNNAQTTVITTTDTTHTDPVDPYIDDDFAPGLALMALMMLCVMVLVFCLFLALAAVSIFIVFLFVSAGIISASIIAGIAQRSFAKGFKVFLVSSSAVGGFLVGAIGFTIATAMFHWHYQTTRAFAIGGIGGLTGGIILGLILYKIVNRLISHLQKK